MVKPLVLQELFGHVGFYGLAAWAHDNERMALQRYSAKHRPLIGCNPALERATNGS